MWVIRVIAELGNFSTFATFFSLYTLRTRIMIWKIACSSIGLLFITLSGTGQVNSPDQALKLYLDCSYCDMILLRSELDYVNNVRDPAVADVHILANRVRSGSNGYIHTLSFMGREDYQGVEFELKYDEAPNTANQERQQKLADLVAKGIIPFWLRTDLVDQLHLEITKKDHATAFGPVTSKDAWNNWIFSVEAGGSINAESNTNEYVGWTRIRGDRVTELWRVRNLLYARFDTRRFENESEVIRSRRERSYASSSVVKSIGDHFSAGFFSSLFRSTYSNYNLSTRLGPALEYSWFPYSQVHERELTIGYRISHLYRDYSEETIYFKLSEHLLNHSVVIAARFKQPWGSLYAQLEGSHFLHDVTQNRLEFEGHLSLRVSKGLSISFGSQIEVINDQRSLPARAISLEELLLGQRQSATSFRINGDLGFRYTFGSIYNNVVNTRL